MCPGGEKKILGNNTVKKQKTIIKNVKNNISSSSLEKEPGSFSNKVARQRFSGICGRSHSWRKTDGKNDLVLFLFCSAHKINIHQQTNLALRLFRHVLLFLTFCFLTLGLKQTSSF